LNTAPPKKGPSAVKGRTAEGLRRKELIDDPAKSMPKVVVNPPAVDALAEFGLLMNSSW